MKNAQGWKAALVVLLLLAAAALAAGAASGLWVLSAVSVGLLFGFFLERSDLCGSAAMSEVILLKDGRKLFGIWTAVVVGMLMFALGDQLGLIKLNPKPLQWLSQLVGGVVFGAGTVLAGGCISGALFKAGQGNMNSLAALAAIPLGISAVEYGPLRPLHEKMLSQVISAEGGGPVTLSTICGLPYWLLAVLFGVATLGAALWWRKKKGQKENPAASAGSAAGRILARPWKPWHSGIAIGVLGLVAWLSSAASGRNYPLGVTHGVLQTELLITDYPLGHVTRPPQPAPAPAPQPAKKVVWWLVLEVLALVLGSHLSARMRGSFKLLPKPPDEMLVAFFGGLLVGAGAAFAGGCVVGNIMSGVALMSVGNIIFAVATLLANWALTRLYLMGWKS